MFLGLTEEAVVKKLILMATSLAMLPATAVLAVAQTEAGSEVQGPITSISGSAVLVEENPADDQLLCLLPEGCDTNSDGVPDLRAGQPAGAVQYDNAA
jgi:hypothetical protein